MRFMKSSRPSALTRRDAVLRRAVGLAVGAAIVATCAALAQNPDPLPSWRDGAARRALVEFVTRVTNVSRTDHVPPSERIAVFDNDGTLWSEQPIYVQVAFALDRVKALAPQRPEWRTTELFASILRGDAHPALSDERALLAVMAATHAGMTTDEFTDTVRQWIASARHPKTSRLYTQMVYQPMLELLAYLRANGFKTFVVSGGGIDFMRPWTEAVYGIPPEQVLGSVIKTTFEMRDGRPVLQRLAEAEVIDDKQGKPINIHRVIGRRPILAFGNSDGDLQMLQWTAAGAGARFMALVHHTDADREVAYDRKSAIGRLDAALDEARSKGWTLVSMKDDWKIVFPE
jgi:phosphoserine phosphatase